MSHSSTACALGFFLYGAFALIAQLLCFQELLIIFSGHELFLGLSLAAWMGWVGAGSALARKQPATALQALVPWAIPLLMTNLIAIRLTKGLFGFGMAIGLLPMLLLTITLLAPIGLLIGVLFSVGCAWASHRSHFSIGRAYLWDTLGTAFGGLVYSWLIAGRLAPEWVMVGLAIPVALLVRTLIPHRRSRNLIAVGTLALAWFVAISPLPRATRAVQWHGYTLLAEHTSRYSHLALAKTGSLVSLFENGVISSHFPDPAAYEELAHWPLLVHDSPHRVLIIGGAATGSLSELLKHSIEHLDYLELDPSVIQMLIPALSRVDRQALEDPRVQIIHQDGRRFLAHTSTRYDVILLALPEPLNAQINRLYTLEAFQLIRHHLSRSGLFAFTIPSSENYLSPETRYFNASLYQTLRAVFPTVELIAGNPLLILASSDPIRLDPAGLTARYRARNLTTTEVVPSYFSIKLDAQRRESLRQQLTTLHVPLNRDFLPVCYTYAWRVWLAKFVSPLYFLGTLVLLASLVLLLRTLWRNRAILTHHPGPVALWTLGFAGIVYETVLLLAFQSLNGYIYWQLGSLFAAFMLGLALGSGLAVRHRTLSAESALRRLRRLLLAAALEGITLMCLLPNFQHVSLSLPWLAPFCSLLAITGVWLGLAFPFAQHVLPASSPAEMAGTLYAADLWGAALGALFTSAIFVPLLGLIPTLGLASVVVLFVYCLLPRQVMPGLEVRN